MDSDWWGSVYIVKEEIEMNKKIVLVDESGTPLLYEESSTEGAK